MKKVLVLMCMAVLAAGTASAAPKKSSKASSDTRVGVGFSQQLSDVGLNSIAARFWVNREFGFEGILGFQMGDNQVIDFGGKFLGALKKEQNLTLYGFGMIGIENYDFEGGPSGTTTSVGGGVGVEFFLQGLPNLAFIAETGIGYSNPNETGAFGTTGSWLSSAGLRYYFQ